jgi:hypothetical protein
MLLVAALDIKTRDVLTVSSINSLLSQDIKVSHFFANLCIEGGGGAANCSFYTGFPMGKRQPCL